MTIQNSLVYCPRCKSNRLGKSVNSDGPFTCAVCGCPDTEAPIDLRMHEEVKRRHRAAERAGKPIKPRGMYKRGGIITR